MKRSLKIAFAIAVTITVLTMGQPLYAQPTPKSQTLPTPKPRTLPAPTPPPPCCSITAINTSTGVVTAKENATRKIFQFKVTNAALLNSLKVGQAVYANFTSNQVSLDGSTACCSIVSSSAPPPTRAFAAAMSPDPAKSALSTAASGRVASSLGIARTNQPPANYGPVVTAVGCSAQSGATDLVITALGFDPARHVVYTIANCGSAATNLPFIVDLFMNGQRTDTIEQKVLPGRSQQTVTSELAVDKGCNQVTLLAVADPQHVISESSGDSHQKTAQITPPCPNLVITEIKQVWVDLNTRYEVQFTIQNQGNGPPPIAITVTEAVASDDGVSIPENNEYSLNPLLPGQSATFHDSKKHLMSATIDVEVIIDMLHQINVSNPNNNIGKRTLGPH